jgi:hypothetical protein
LFTQAILSEPSANKQRKAVADVVREAINNGSFTYTELLSAQEPMRTYALEFLDGVTVENSTPRPGGQVENWQGQPIKLVHIKPTGVITAPVIQELRIIGTTDVKPVKATKSFGNVADVGDYYPDRLARMILVQKGWPIRQVASKGAVIGEIVEWRWLEKEAARSDAAPGVKELYDEIRTRPGIAVLDSKSKAPERRAGA